eukprot:6890321-Prymnesium_polylepis.2
MEKPVFTGTLVCATCVDSLTHLRPNAAGGLWWQLTELFAVLRDWQFDIVRPFFWISWRIQLVGMLVLGKTSLIHDTLNRVLFFSWTDITFALCLYRGCKWGAKRVVSEPSTVAQRVRFLLLGFGVGEVFGYVVANVIWLLGSAVMHCIVYACQACGWGGFCAIGLATWYSLETERVCDCALKLHTIKAHEASIAREVTSTVHDAIRAHRARRAAQMRLNLQTVHARRQEQPNIANDREQQNIANDQGQPNIANDREQPNIANERGGATEEALVAVDSMARHYLARHERLLAELPRHLEMERRRLEEAIAHAPWVSTAISRGLLCALRLENRVPLVSIVLRRWYVRVGTFFAWSWLVLTFLFNQLVLLIDAVFTITLGCCVAIVDAVLVPIWSELQALRPMVAEALSPLVGWRTAAQQSHLLSFLVPVLVCVVFSFVFYPELRSRRFYSHIVNSIVSGKTLHLIRLVTRRPVAQRAPQEDDTCPICIDPLVGDDAGALHSPPCSQVGFCLTAAFARVDVRSARVLSIRLWPRCPRGVHVGLGLASKPAAAAGKEEADRVPILQGVDAADRAACVCGDSGCGV